jgi:tRNA(Arg) A34 adenosine deaminase TadA
VIDASALDAHWLRASFALARAAEARGDQPYGAVLVDAAGSVLAEAGNTIVTTADPTAHAELNLVRRIGRVPAKDFQGMCRAHLRADADMVEGAQASCSDYSVVSLSCLDPSATDAPDEKKDEAGFTRRATWR